MNKAVINTYKKSFDFWLQDEPVLVRHLNDAVHANIGWKPLDSSNFFSTGYIYIKDDFAVNFRKAIAEGKKIMFWKIKEQHPTDESKDIYEWRELKSITIDHAFEKDLSLYKIV